MKAAGLDVGSRTLKLVILNGNRIIWAAKSLSSFDQLGSVLNLLNGLEYDRITVTGYGRHLVSAHLGCSAISEIKAFAIGSKAIFPECGVVLDIGGQDTKVISLGEKNEIKKFEMNDKCAAGTGRFLEIMANALNYSLDEFAVAASSASKSEKINNMCTVFAESEVISLIAKGAKREEIALSIHEAIASRSVALLKRVELKGEILFAGGVALNRFLCNLIARELKRTVHVPADPQIVGAIGAAIHASGSEIFRVLWHDGKEVEVKAVHG